MNAIFKVLFLVVALFAVAMAVAEPHHYREDGNLFDNAAGVLNHAADDIGIRGLLG